MGKTNLQDTFMNALRKAKTPCTVFTMNGVKISGVVLSFDTYTLLLGTDIGQQMIFKHAVSTVIPSKPVDVRHEEPSGE